MMLIITLIAVYITTGLVLATMVESPIVLGISFGILWLPVMAWAMWRNHGQQWRDE